MSKKQWVLVLLCSALGLLVMCSVCVAVIVSIAEETPVVSAPAAPGSAPASTSGGSRNALVEEFGCQWIMDTYRPMAILGRDPAIQHLANSMNLKKNPSVFSYVTTGDAAQALRECEG